MSALREQHCEDHTLVMEWRLLQMAIHTQMHERETLRSRMSMVQSRRDMVGREAVGTALEGGGSRHGMAIHGGISQVHAHSVRWR